MHEQYYLDSELRVAQSPEGLKRATISKKFIGSSDIAKETAKATDEFRTDIENLLDQFDDESVLQEDEINENIKHIEFFLHDKFKKHEWGHNREFDQLRLNYIQILESLKKERRSLRKERIQKKITFKEKILDARKELTPFKELL